MRSIVFIDRRNKNSYALNYIGKIKGKTKCSQIFLKALKISLIYRQQIKSSSSINIFISIVYLYLKFFKIKLKIILREYFCFFDLTKRKLRHSINKSFNFYFNLNFNNYLIYFCLIYFFVYDED